MECSWRWYTFPELSAEDLYTILKLRQMVFVVEQHCPYLDCDGLDHHAWHLVGKQTDRQDLDPITYLRIIPPGISEQMVIIGRVLTHPGFRGNGVAKKLLSEALRHIETHYQGLPITLSAQSYLVEFYQHHGFTAISDIYLEDGIPHIKMVRFP